MGLLDWPALADMTELPATLSVEHAIWGKVHGQKSDFRWIARSPGFVGHHRRVEAALRVGMEDVPMPMPVWRCVDGRFYAVWCYQSPSSDAASRKNFLEKQILEWVPPGGVPAAAAALVLMSRAATLSFDSWFPHHADPRWSDDRFALEIPALTVPIDEERVAAEIADGCRFWHSHPAEALAGFFAAREQALQPSFVFGFDRGIPAAALAVLLLPFPDHKGRRLSMAGGIPSSGLGDAGDGRWDAIVSGAGSNAGLPISATARARAGALRMNDPVLARGLTPSVVHLITFADGPERWMDAPASNQPQALSDTEQSYINQAIAAVRAQAVDLSELPIGLANARRRHLELKADVVEAAAHRLFGMPSKGARVAEVLAMWDRAVPPKARQR